MRGSEPFPFVRWSMPYILAASLVLLLASAYFRKQLPVLPEILPQLQNTPTQTSSDVGPFLFEYWGKQYLIQPVADYELWGLVVTHNDIRSITDMYHDRSSVDVKDLCVVWGNNVQSDIYTKAEYSSAPWTCYFRFNSRSEGRRFNQNQLSNNHILADNSTVREVINAASIGDQIHLKGLLVNYGNGAAPVQMRKSSTSRKDRGNGACEVIYVQSAEILKKGNAVWHVVYELAFKSSVAVAILWPVLSLLSIYLYQRRLYAHRPLRSNRG